MLTVASTRAYRMPSLWAFLERVFLNAQIKREMISPIICIDKLMLRSTVRQDCVGNKEQSKTE